MPATNPPDHTLHAIETRYPSLSRAGRAVADRVLHDPDSVPRTPLGTLARECGVSEPSVIRFCRAIGYNGYGEFRVRLAGSLAVPVAYGDFALSPDASAEEYTSNVVEASLGTLLRLRETLDASAIEDAVATLARARRIEFYGVGASGIVALDAQHKFFRLSIPATAHQDAHMQRMAAAALEAGDAAVVFSHTGRSRALIETVRLARRSGATTIAVTAAHTPLAHSVDGLVPVDVPEDTDHFTPMVSRLAQLVVVDALALGVALRGDEHTQARLRRVKEALADERLPANDGPPRRKGRT